MKTTLQVTGAIIGLLVVLLGIAWIAQGADFFMFRFWAPKYEQVRRDTFEQSRAFNQGMIQELENMQFEYVKTTDENAKAALRSVILHRASGYNLNDSSVPQSLRTFIQELKNQ